MKEKAEIERQYQLARRKAFNSYIEYKNDIVSNYGPLWEAYIRDREQVFALGWVLGISSKAVKAWEKE